jgi:hypothetical protein
MNRYCDECLEQALSPCTYLLLCFSTAFSASALGYLDQYENHFLLDVLLFIINLAILENIFKTHSN